MQSVGLESSYPQAMKDDIDDVLGHGFIGDMVIVLVNVAGEERSWPARP